MEPKLESPQPEAGGAIISSAASAASDLSPERKLRLLMQISRQGYDTLDLDKLLNHLLDAVVTVASYDAAGIFVLSRELIDTPYVRPQQVIAGVARRGFDELPVETDPMLTLGKGIVGHVIRTGRPVVVPDVRRDSRYVTGRKRTSSEIAVPILLEERVIGALNLESDHLGAFGEGYLDVLHFFADAAALSIEKAMLHRQILVAAEVNGHLLESTGRKDFITCLYGILDSGSGRFSYVNCGHNPPLFLEGPGCSRTLRNGNPILGIFADVRYDTEEIVLAPGDRLILYTDGVVESEDDGGAAFGVGGVAAVAEDAGPVSSEALIGAIVAEVRAFRGRERFEDDVTIVVIGREGPSKEIS